MSIYSTPISALSTADLQELLDDKSVENIRLEFKREVPDKDETLKKLSSFANTFGGLLVVGAGAGNDGRITDLRGVEPQPSYKQTIVQWCTGGATPPITVEVSDPIPVPADGGRVCYAVNVPESDLVPHYLNGRKGLWIRTDEFSSRFEPRLATETETRYLLDRRRLVRERRVALIQRFHERFEAFRALPPGEEGPDTTLLPTFLMLSVVPKYPARPVVEHAELLDCLRRSSVAWRQVGFPRDLNVVSHHESALALRPVNRLSLLEANIWGGLSYAAAIAERRPGDQQRGEPPFEGIHTPHFIGLVLVFLKHAARMTAALHLTGALRVEVLLQGVRGVSWRTFPRGFSEHGSSSVLDDTVAFSVPTSADALTSDSERVAMDVLRLVFFAINWPETADDAEKLALLVKEGYRYNFWRT
jgi:hypothetical protein